MRNKRILSLDIIKGIAMIMVILVHYNQSFTSNITFFKYFQMGCQLFFVSSGFGAAKSFHKKLENNNYAKATKDFYISRVRAIAPAWWIMIAVVYLANTFFIYFFKTTLNFGTNRSFIGILCNVLFLNGIIPACNNSVMPGGWYIGTTMVLYFITPLLLLLFSKFRMKLVCAVLSLLSLLGIIGLYTFVKLLFPAYINLIANNNSFIYFSFVSQLPSFALGILLYHENQIENNDKNQYKYFIAGTIIFILSILLFFCPFFPLSYIVTGILVGLATYYILKAMIIYEQKNGIRKNVGIIKFGNKSLYIYLVHAFFVWTFVYVCKKFLSYLDLISDSYLIYVLLMPIVLALSYYFGCILNWIVNKVVSKIHKQH